MARPLKILAVLGALIFCGGLTFAHGVAAAAGAADAAMPEAPTIERVVIVARGASELEGSGTPGSLVRLISDGQALGEATVDQGRKWRVVVKNGLPPGVHQIQSRALGAVGGVVSVGDEIRVSVPAVLGETAVVAYEGGRPATSNAVAPQTRERAEELAKAANEAYGEVMKGETGSTKGPEKVAGGGTAAAPSSSAAEAQDGPEATGPGGAIVEWLKRSARAYRGEIVDKLAVSPPGADFRTGVTSGERAEVPAGDAARQIAEERRKAEAALAEKRKADAARKASEAEKAAAEKARREAEARKASEEMARKKAEYDSRIKNGLSELEKAAKEANGKTALATGKTEAQKPVVPLMERPKITFERFTLPGQKPEDDEEETRVAEGDDADEIDSEDNSTRVTGGDAARSRREAAGSSGKCRVGRVVMRKGKRYYVTGRSDTLWGIAKRYYGNGSAYPRIYRVNRNRLSSPDIVRPCQVLRLPGRRR